MNSTRFYSLLFLCGFNETIYAIKKIKKHGRYPLLNSESSHESRFLKSNPKSKRRERKRRRKCKKQKKKYPEMNINCSTLNTPSSKSPSVVPSSLPTIYPSIFPSEYPSIFPSIFPTSNPSFLPSISIIPTVSSFPSMSPTSSLSPSFYPSTSKYPTTSLAPSVPIYLLRFDELLANPEIAIPQGYFNLKYENLFIVDQSIVRFPNNGYKKGMRSQPNVAYSGKNKAAKILAMENEAFSVYSLWCTSAWENELEVTFEGVVRKTKAKIIYSIILSSPDDSKFVELNGFDHLSSLKISTKPSSQVVLDNISISLY